MGGRSRPRWIPAVLVGTFLIAPFLLALGVPGALVGRLVLISLGLTLIAALVQVVVGIRRNGELLARWRNPRIRRWWVGNAALGGGLVLVALVASPRLYFSDDVSSPRFVVLAIAVLVARLLRSALNLDEENRPPELPTPPKPFSGLRAMFRRRSDRSS